MVHTDINFKKSDEEVDEILKPDLPGYDPFKLLAYNHKTNRFAPSPEIEDEALRQRIAKMIKLLQLNHGMVHYERETFFANIKGNNKLESQQKIDRFFTAYEMVKAKESFLMKGE